MTIIKNATLPGEQTWRGEVGTIEAQCKGEALSPCIVVVGQVAALA